MFVIERYQRPPMEPIRDPPPKLEYSVPLIGYFAAGPGL